jgi:rhodanese-related sulfurtransferase
MALVHTTVKDLSFDEASGHVEGGAAYVDLRAVDEYLDVHIPGSLSLQYEFGPGFPGRARDCIPLEVPLVLLDRADVDMAFAAASLRGKGFAILGRLEDGLHAWSKEHGHPASTEIQDGGTAPSGTVLNVGDPGTAAIDGTRIPLGRLWSEAKSFAGSPIAIVASRGVRAALAVGMLENRGAGTITFWRVGGAATAGGR